LLVLSFVNETRLLRFGAEEDGIEEVDSLSGFSLDHATLDAFSHASGAYQVTKAGVQGTNGASWQAADGKSITVSAHRDDLLALGFSGGGLAILQVSEDGQLRELQ
jgi:hypothetical protein